MNFTKYNGDGQCKTKKQLKEQVIDISVWRGNEEIDPLVGGRRAKRKIYCPNPAPYSFLIPEHLYFFKQSKTIYPAEFWIEVIASRLGCLMGVPVQAAFIGIDTERRIAGTVIEYFHNYPGDPSEDYVPGLYSFMEINPDYIKGKSHNFTDLTCIVDKLPLETTWREHWAKIYCFDALLGNTDRHQDNWGLVSYVENKNYFYFSPAFDNNSSLGHELPEDQLTITLSGPHLEKYVSGKRATHHLTLNRNDPKRLGHFDLLRILIDRYPEMAEFMRSCIEFDIKAFAYEIEELLHLSNGLSESYAKLTPERAKFVIKLVEYRIEKARRLLD